MYLSAKQVDNVRRTELKNQAVSDRMKNKILAIIQTESRHQEAPNGLVEDGDEPSYAKYLVENEEDIHEGIDIRLNNFLQKYVSPQSMQTVLNNIKIKYDDTQIELLVRNNIKFDLRVSKTFSGKMTINEFMLFLADFMSDIDETDKKRDKVTTEVSKLISKYENQGHTIKYNTAQKKYVVTNENDKIMVSQGTTLNKHGDKLRELHPLFDMSSLLSNYESDEEEEGDKEDYVSVEEGYESDEEEESDADIDASVEALKQQLKYLANSDIKFRSNVNEFVVYKKNGKENVIQTKKLRGLTEEVLKDDPDYDLASLLNKSGNGLKLIRRIITGRGGLLNQDKWLRLNKYMIDMHSLLKNKLVVKYVRNYGYIKSIPRLIISNDVKHMIYQLVVHETFSREEFLNMSDEDQAVFYNFSEQAHIYTGIHDVKMNKLIKEGEVNAGNMAYA